MVLVCLNPSPSLISPGNAETGTIHCTTYFTACCARSLRPWTQYQEAMLTPVLPSS